MPLPATAGFAFPEPYKAFVDFLLPTDTSFRDILSAMTIALSSSKLRPLHAQANVEETPPSSLLLPGGEGEGEGEEEARDEPVDDLGRTIADARRGCETEKERENLDRMLEDHKKSLYPGCDNGLKKLGCTLDLLKWKAQEGVADSGFENLLKMLKNMFPKNNEFSTYEAKKVVCPLGLEVLKIHACINDCILYRGEYENLNECPLYMLAKTPSSTITTFQGYEINGNTFYTIAQDKKSTNQNSGVRFDAATENGQKVTYYGYIEEIWELDYGPSFKVPLFRCKWFKLTGGGVKVDQQYGMTMVDFNNLGYLDELFVLAKDVAQVFYVKDMSSKPRKRKDKKTISTSCDDPKRHIVLSGKRNIVGVEGKTDMSEDYNMFGEIPPFKVNTDPSIKLNDEDAPWIRLNRKQAGTHGKK
ncbi:hypothetical protein QYE76_054721 [Lolium multiflorum]|uniref:DUF4216 domain-containing protein n=1 Tax=Lolium multiflorum TaxID=4521 RepID=A0AAD8WL51_LOLMU|nr:hypothetical protein QYE76_054721 [Lolium multiflorum]